VADREESRTDAATDAVAVLDRVVAGFGGEQRDGQRSLTAAVAAAVAGERHLVAEAPTGSGKSLAYLSAAVASGRRVVVATSTIALQSQLVEKDLPMLARHGGVSFSVALLKGRSNYLCRAKLRAAARPDALFEVAPGPGFDGHLRALEGFSRTAVTGDRAELAEPVVDATWAAVSCTSAECPGRLQCADGENCFAEQARARAIEADVLVVNHALYCADLRAFGAVLPDHDVVVLDEAHAFAENATNAFGDDLAPEGLSRLAAMLNRAGVDAKAVRTVVQAADGLEGLLETRDGPVTGDGELTEALAAAAESLAAAQRALGQPETDSGRRAGQILRSRLEALRRLGDPGPGDVVWVERQGRRRRVRLAPVAVGDTLAERLLADRVVVAVSATLGGRPPFATFTAQLGLGADDHEALAVPSSFDWSAQGMLYVARELPDPGRDADAWAEAAAARAEQLVAAAGGRALVLCTSRAAVTRFAERLRSAGEHTVLVQGEDDAGRLAREFVANETSVLVGTRSFWAGIDAPGAACVLVVIDRIPFPSPGDPLHAARRGRAAAAGADAFATVDLPAASLVLAQGAGRLLRTRHDRGVVAVLDPRLATRNYRRELLAGVPPLRRTVDADEVCAFLVEATAEA